MCSGDNKNLQARQVRGSRRHPLEELKQLSGFDVGVAGVCYMTFLSKTSFCFSSQVQCVGKDAEKMRDLC